MSAHSISRPLLSFFFSSRGLACLLLLLLAALAYMAAPLYSDISDLYARDQWHRDMVRRDFYSYESPRLVEHIRSLNPASASETFDRVRELIHANTSMDFDNAWTHKPGLILDRIAACALDGADPSQRPQIKCYMRALAMSVLLHNLGYESRLVHAVGVDAQGAFYGSHSFLEVFNPETGRWEYQDPYYNTAFKRRDNGMRAQTLDLALGTMDDFEPVSPDTSPEALPLSHLDRLMAIVVYDNRMNGEKSVCLVNGRRAGPQGSVLHDAQDLDPTVLAYIRSIWFDVVYVML